MCLIAFAWNAHPDYRLVVGANRDEWHDRSATPAGWWKDHPEILAGRDLKAGGTWMGVTRNGRFAAVTNFRDPGDKRSTARSRGELVTAFLNSETTPEKFLSATKQQSHEYNGFNLIVGDTSSLAYFSSVRGDVNSLAPGVYALSNHTLNEPWPKVKAAKSALEAALQAEMPEKARQMAILNFLSDTTNAADGALPDTGVSIEWERVLSPALIVTPKYGTRASTILSLTNAGDLAFAEHTRAVNGSVSSVTEFHFKVHPD
ncbi:MAG: NRDE family protein [Burkholderiales bacterium]|nr:NRDE family protein [Burkholderiales bacterium]